MHKGQIRLTRHAEKVNFLVCFSSHDQNLRLLLLFHSTEVSRSRQKKKIKQKNTTIESSDELGSGRLFIKK